MSAASGDECVSPKRNFPKHLTEIYDVDHDHPLGAGAFSTVFRCKNRKTGQVLALKQIDTRRGIEHSPRNIAHEIAMMKLAGRHDNVMGCYAVQLEGPCVNIVVDMFSGGDLIDGLNLHMKDYGSLRDAQLAHLLRQMVAAVLHVHSLHIVHRDVKGENFLSNMADIGNSNCQIALADFGSAARVEPGERLSGRVGTSAFWAPEVWAGEYDSVVDIWALGMTAFILLAGSLPFQSEVEICRAEGPQFSIPRHASDPCSSFIRSCLARNPQERLNAEQAAHHPWLTNTQPHEQSVVGRTLQTTMRRGLSAAGFTLRFVAGFCSCCVEIVEAGVTELVKDQSKKSKQDSSKALIEGSSSPPREVAGHALR